MAGPFTELDGDDPRGILLAISGFLGDGGERTREELVEAAAKIALEEDMNIFRVMAENPDETREILGIPPNIDGETLEKFDRLADA